MDALGHSRRRRPAYAVDDVDEDDEDDLADTADASQHATVPPKAKKARRSSAAAPLAAASGTSQETEVIGLHHRPVVAGRVSLCPRRLDVENGTLLSVRLVNFKSHRHFEMTFGPRLNFIVGRNGTGKSSILAAIIVALGGNPNKYSGTAGGSKSASSLICDGADSASVELRIANGGPDAFTLECGAAPATLIVRLRLSRASATRTSSTYSINDSSISLKKVRELADFYNYEVENPTVINTQAVSASFLKDPKDAQRRYTFFLRAANLESLKMDYAQGHDELRQMGIKLDSHEEQRARLYERLEEAQQRADAARERLDLERTIAQQERRAAYCLRRVLLVTPHDERALRERSRLLVNLGLPDAAIKGYLALLKLRPHDKVVVRELAKLHHSSGALDKAYQNGLLARARDRRTRADALHQAARHRAAALRGRARGESERLARMAAEGHAARVPGRGPRRAARLAPRAQALAAGSAEVLLRLAGGDCCAGRRGASASGRARTAVVACESPPHLDAACPRDRILAVR
jgi:hypothetical protein